jgi:hypothetical protein
MRLAPASNPQKGIIVIVGVGPQEHLDTILNVQNLRYIKPYKVLLGFKKSRHCYYS